MDIHQVIYLGQPEAFQLQESLYLRVRQAEMRIQEDDVVHKLPDTPANHPYHHEWQLRKRSFQRFEKYLNRMFTGPMRILDLGCGNGWMSNQLAKNTKHEVWAVDVNQFELEQGARLFSRQNLQFYYADIFQNPLPEQHFQVIVLAASVQYFPDLPELLKHLKRLLVAGGEIHVVDSPFYPDEAGRVAARDRTLAYYEKVGVPEMAAFYHHHLWQDAQELGGENLNNNLIVKVMQRLKILPAFPWVRFRSG